jgi:hypothetical protein
VLLVLSTRPSGGTGHTRSNQKSQSGRYADDGGNSHASGGVGLGMPILWARPGWLHVAYCMRPKRAYVLLPWAEYEPIADTIARWVPVWLSSVLFICLRSTPASANMHMYEQLKQRGPSQSAGDEDPYTRGSDSSMVKAGQRDCQRSSLRIRADQFQVRADINTHCWWDRLRKSQRILQARGTGCDNAIQHFYYLDQW